MTTTPQDRDAGSYVLADARRRARVVDFLAWVAFIALAAIAVGVALL